MIRIVNIKSACIYRSGFQSFKKVNKQAQNYLEHLFNFIKFKKKLQNIISCSLYSWCLPPARRVQVSVKSILVLLRGPIPQPTVSTTSVQMQVKTLPRGHVLWEVSISTLNPRSCQPDLWESSQAQESYKLEPSEPGFPRASLATTVVYCWPKLQSSVYTQSKGYNKQHREKEISSKFLFC